MEKRIKKFEDLDCWQEARKLVKLVYQTTTTHPFSKDFGLKEQIQKAAISTMANIAEGFDAFSNPEFIRFLGFALRSCSEVQSHLYAALDIGYISPNNFYEVYEQGKKCSNYIKAFLKYLRSKQSS